MRKPKQLALGLLVITLAILTGWRLWIWQQNRVPAVPTLLSQATLEAERISTWGERFDLYHRIALEWLHLGETDKTRALMGKMEAALRNFDLREYAGRERRLFMMATLWLELNDEEAAKRVAAEAFDTNFHLYPLEQTELQRFFVGLIQRASPETTLLWVESLRPRTADREISKINREVAMRALWQAAIAAGNPEFAERVARRDELLVSDLVILAQGYQQQGSLASANAIWNEAIQRFNAKPDADSAASLSRALHARGHSAQAKAVLQTALQHAHRDPRALPTLAQTALDIEEPALARAALERLLQDNRPKRALINSIVDNATLFQRAGLTAAARSLVMQHGRPSEQVRFLMQVNEWDEAVRLAISNLDTIYPLHLELTNALLKAGRTQDARRILNAAARKNELKVVFARHYASQGNLQAALQMIEALRGHQYDSALLGVVEGLIEAGKLQEAEQLLASAPSMHASDWLPSSTLPRIAQGYIERKQYREAWRIARTLTTPDARARIMLDLASELRREQASTHRN